MANGRRGMAAAVFVVLGLGGLLGCKKGTVPAAPVQKGGYLVYQVSVSGPGATDSFDFKIAFDDVTPDAVAITTEAKDLKSTMRLSPALLPEKGILEFSLPGSAQGLGAGMLWLPPDQRKQGVITKAGTIDKQQMFDKWDVWAISGRVGTYIGTRFYEVNTGMLVGFTQSMGAVEIGGKLKDSK